MSEVVLKGITKKYGANTVVNSIDLTAENGKLILPDIDFSEILKYADYILCEADGSRGLPLKAHEVYEPVIPKESVETIQVMGVKGIGGKIKNVCHRAELYAELTGLDTEYTVTPQIAAKVINAEIYAISW